MTVLPALLAMFAWGTMDFLGKLAVDRLDPRKVLLGEQLGGMLTCLLLLPVVSHRPDWSQVPWLPLLVGGSVYTAASLFLLKGYTVGSVSIVSPLAASYGGWTVLAAVIWLGESPSVMQWIAAAGLVVGVVLVARTAGDQPEGARSTLGGILCGLAAMIGFGTFMVVVKPVNDVLGPFWSVFMLRLISLLVMLPVAWPPWRGLGRPKEMGMLLLIGALEIVAMFFYTLGVDWAGVSITSPVAAAFPLVTIVLARIFLRERMNRIQVAGVGLILVGTVVLSAT